MWWRCVPAPAPGSPVAETVRVNVANVDEPGVVRLSPAQPQAATALTAALSDPDGVVRSRRCTVVEVAALGGR